MTACSEPPPPPSAFIETEKKSCQGTEEAKPKAFALLQVKSSK
jgi:hypothetical protein